MDKYPPQKRSEVMRAVTSKNTKPEKVVRMLLHRMGLRFRLHSKTLPGSPDIVLMRWKTVIFVNGCFWHQHRGCARAKRPQHNKTFWDKKLDRNIQRDKENKKCLKKLGWRVLEVWECELRDIGSLMQKLTSHFGEINEIGKE